MGCGPCLPRAELQTLLGTMETTWGSEGEKGAGVRSWILYPPPQLMSAGTWLRLGVLATN